MAIPGPTPFRWGVYLVPIPFWGGWVCMVPGPSPFLSGRYTPWEGTLPQRYTLGEDNHIQEGTPPWQGTTPTPPEGTPSGADI